VSDGRLALRGDVDRIERALRRWLHDAVEDRDPRLAAREALALLDGAANVAETVRRGNGAAAVAERDGYWDCDCGRDCREPRPPDCRRAWVGTSANAGLDAPTPIVNDGGKP
jgi:hypothetical protein